MAAGYDISASFSNAGTFANKFGDQNVGGGLKIPGWVWFVAAGVGLLFVWKKYFAN
jgi:hypothetical protein